MSQDSDSTRTFPALAVVIMAFGVLFLIMGNIGFAVTNFLVGGILFLVRRSQTSSPRLKRPDPFPLPSDLDNHQAAQLSFDDYVQLVRELPMPSTKQMRDFAQFVAHAHSWYKHLPLLPPGSPFQFFLDPGAGMQRVVSADGELSVSPRTERGFHYSWIPTDEYRERFGHLAYSRSAGTKVIFANAGRQLVPSDDEPLIYDSQERCLASLPRKVLDEGSASVSGIVHTHTASYPSWWLTREADGLLVDWPEESGGRAGVEKILSRCRELVESRAERQELHMPDPRVRRNRYLIGVDYPLYEALQPERRRQLAGMVAAMQRVIQLTHGSDRKTPDSSE